MQLHQSLLLEAFTGQNTTVPVWFMRQAGRYLPEYQALKKMRPLNELFRTPDIACEITLQPVRILGVDAAILFADILTLPSAMGFSIDFIDGKGPVIDNPILSGSDIDRIHDFDNLGYVAETVRLIKKNLPVHVPLIGFAGSPFTILTYLMGTSSGFGKSKPLHLALTDMKAYHRIMNILTDNTIRYLHLQQEAGIDIFQIFDTGAGILPENAYRAYVLPYIQHIFRSVRGNSIYYLKNCHHLLPAMTESGADFLSVCETVTLGENELLNSTDLGIQGNLYNGYLYAPWETIQKEIDKILKAAGRHHSKYIFNLNHGIFPDVPVETVKRIVDYVHQYSWTVTI